MATACLVWFLSVVGCGSEPNKNEPERTSGTVDAVEGPSPLSPTAYLAKAMPRCHRLALGSRESADLIRRAVAAGQETDWGAELTAK